MGSVFCIFSLYATICQQIATCHCKTYCTYVTLRGQYHPLKIWNNEKNYTIMPEKQFETIFQKFSKSVIFGQNMANLKICKKFNKFYTLSHTWNLIKKSTKIGISEIKKIVKNE